MFITKGDSVVKNIVNKSIITICSVILAALGMSGIFTNVNAASANLIANPSMEQANSGSTAPLNWQTDNWGTNKASFQYKNTGYQSSHSSYISMSGYKDGDAKWFFDPIAVQPSTTYTFSETYQSSIKTHIVAMSLDANNVATYFDVDVAVPASATAWKSITYNIKSLANTKKLTILHLIEGNGWLQTDNFNLTSQQTPPPTGIVPNSSVETPDPANPNQPLSWSTSSWGTNSHTFSYVNGGAADGSRSVQACVTKYGTDPNVSGDANWQFASQPLVKGADYRATFSYKTNNLHAVHVVAHYVKADGTEDFFGMPDPEPTGDNATNWTTYSDVFNVPTDVVSADVIMVMRGVGCVSVDNMQLTPYTYTGFDKGRVVLTFDDAPDINYLNALPLLDKYGFKTTLYLPTKEGAYAPGWVEGNASMEAIVKKFAADGHEIGAHTVSHPDMTTLACPGTQLTFELKHPQDYLRTLTGQPITDYASPNGAYDECTNSVTSQYYGSHRTTDEGYNSKDNFNAYRLRDQNMAPTTPLSLFKYWVDKAAHDHTTLVLTYHNIDDPNNPAQMPADTFDTYLADFKAQMAYLSSKGVAVERMDTALTEMRAQP